MKKLVFISFLMCLIVFIPFSTNAQLGTGLQSGQGSGQGNKEQLRIQDPTINDDGEYIPQGNQVQNQNKNQIEMQNQGLEDQLNINARNQAAPNYGLNNTRERMSRVAKAVQDILLSTDASGGIGKQISEIATNQQNAQAEIEEILDEIENRKGFVRQVFGPDYGALREMKSLVYQNQNRIQQLQMLETNIQNQTDKNNLQQVIASMIEQNTSLQEQIQFEEDKPGIFGWLIKLFN